MLYGLGSALGFGLGDLFGADQHAQDRRPGDALRDPGRETSSLLALLLLTPLPGELSASGAAWAAIAAAGVAGHGVLPVVLPRAAARARGRGEPGVRVVAAVSVLLAVVFNGERLSAMASAGIALTIAGVALASAQGDGPEGDGPRSWGGIPYALAATVAWGVASYLIGRYAQQTGWYLPVVRRRALVEFVADGHRPAGARLAATSPAVPTGQDARVPRRRRRWPTRRASRCSRARARSGLVSITSAVSATFPLVVIAGGLILFHERPTPIQWLGVLAAIIGLVLLGLGRMTEGGA